MSTRRRRTTNTEVSLEGELRPIETPVTEILDHVDTAEPEPEPEPASESEGQLTEQVPAVTEKEEKPEPVEKTKSSPSPAKKTEFIRKPRNIPKFSRLRNAGK